VPIYEFYCAACHTVFNFLARRPSAKRPACPRCSRPRLERRVSAFAITKGRAEPGAEAATEEPDEVRMEAAMADLAADAERVDENDPRQMARFMRRFFERSGMPIGPGVEEAMRRMESGEDPDAIEDEMGDLLDQDGEAPAEPGPGGLARLARRLRAPQVDPTLYEL
jgi:putative FmdB family regulatory protein